MGIAIYGRYADGLQISFLAHIGGTIAGITIGNYLHHFLNVAIHRYFSKSRTIFVNTFVHLQYKTVTATKRLKK